MRRLLLLLWIVLLPLCAYPEEQQAETPLTLPAATSEEEVLPFLLLPPEDGLTGVERGYIRYISQNMERDELFRPDYWRGGLKGSLLDLNVKERYGKKLPSYAGNMCTRATYSMALSYFGIDMSPGQMSAVTNTRELREPYDEISAMVGVEGFPLSNREFNAAVENYLTDPSYSPVYLYYLRPDGTTHSVLVVARIPEKGRFLVVDSNPPQSGGKLYRVYFISLNPQRTKIVNSTFREYLKGSEILSIYQWRLLPEESAAAPSPQPSASPGT